MYKTFGTRIKRSHLNDGCSQLTTMAKKELHDCRICGNSDSNFIYHAKEMMFGYRHHFEYFQCSICDCLQISAFPLNLGYYYPSHYYSFAAALPNGQSQGIAHRLKCSARRLRNRYAAVERGFLAMTIRAAFPNVAKVLHTSLNAMFPPDGIKSLGVTTRDRILDVGCGSGALLSSLSQMGFKRLLGVDPYIHSDIIGPTGVKILKSTLREINDSWDIIMFHHSFEHMPDQLETLRSVSYLLSEKGLCLVRIPVVSSYAWKHYGEHWVQLDPPRHFFLHSLKSMKLLAGKAGLKVERIVYDSTGFQFWGSEQYLNNIPLMSGCSYAINPQKSIFSKEDINGYEEKASWLNSKGQGDQAAFYLRRH